MGLSQWRNFLFILAIAAHICVLHYAASVSVRFKSKGKCYGEVQIQDKNLETFDDDRWHFNNSKVLCRSTSCGTPVQESLKPETTSPDFWCTGNENSFDKCWRMNNKTQNSTGNKAFVVCSNAISQPRISLTLPNGTSINSSHAEIPRGSNFSMECSVDSIPGKLKFYFLRQYNGNSTKLESNHSPYFNISKADYKNEGNYSCRYTVNGVYESDESGWIHVTVREPWWKLLFYILLAGFLVLLMVLLVACLVCRRRKRAEKPSDVVLNQVTVRNSYIDDEEEEEEERDYVNVEPVNTNSLGTEEMDVKDSDSNDYEDPSQDKNDSSDDEHDYVDTTLGPIAAKDGTKGHSEEEDSSEDEHDYVNPTLGPVAARDGTKGQSEEEDSSDDEHDYVNSTLGPAAARDGTKGQSEEEDSSDDEHDYVNSTLGPAAARDGTKGQSEEEDSSDDGEDYVNLEEQIVDIYGEDLDIYQNL
ncbi:uncharacterized protein LOC106963672 isoform X2 [Poecilia latipinna]|uniref:uncharacterized protein LOC106963672 isoform X2 n=1 Tax=Poecilia latipinna TaxID=48699 RepID=UPI00072EE358|nr:PREDICTED: uncharacterized protein LOC106963672 isoform X2 [Poecilia latipinna]